MNKYQEYQAKQEQLWAERRQRLDAQKQAKMIPAKTLKPEPKKQNAMYQTSNTGTLHIIDTEMTGLYDKNLAKCQSYNLDRPNYLDGTIYHTTDGHSKLCKKCFGR